MQRACSRWKQRPDLFQRFLHSLLKLSPSPKILVPFLAWYVLDFLLLTPAGLETRPQSDVTGFGFVVVIFWFVGVVLALICIALAFRRPRMVFTLALTSAFMSVPTVLADQARMIHSGNPPTIAITVVEFVQLIVAVAIVVLALRVRSRVPSTIPSTLSTCCGRYVRILPPAP